MLHASPGFICLAETPTLGTVEMLGEDAADRYLITGLENRTTNRPLILLARSFLNPGRSLANVMAFRVPWHREDRLGLLGEDFRTRNELVADYKAGGEKAFEYVRPPQTPNEDRTYPKEADIELTAFPVYESFLGGGNCIGGGGSGAPRLNSGMQLVAGYAALQSRERNGQPHSADSTEYTRRVATNSLGLICLSQKGRV